MESFDIKKYRAPRDCSELGMMGCVWFVIGTGFFSTLFGVFLYHGFYKSFKGLIVISVFLFFVYNLVKSFFIVMYTDTYVDKNWVPPNATKEELDSAIKNAPKLDEEFKTDKYARSLNHYESVRWCTKCKAFKPPRSHHCRECNRCTLRMDHHCPWVGSCIGYYTQKAFILFLIYAELSITMSCVLNIISMDENDENVGVVVLLLIATVLTSSFGVGLIPLIVGQLSSAMSNETTFEDIINYRIRQKHKSFVIPYDVGRSNNFRQFMGNSPLKWFIPDVPKRSIDEGTYFPTRKVTSESIV